MLSGECYLLKRIYSSSLYISCNNSTYSAIKKLFKFPKIHLGAWNSLNISPSGSLTIRNNYIPFSKRFLFREIISDSSLLSSKDLSSLENVALYIDEKSIENYRAKSEEISLLYRPLTACGLVDVSVKPKSSISQENSNVEPLNSRERLDHEYWFLCKLADIAPDAGFTEISSEALQEATYCPQLSRISRVKTYVDPANYDVLRIWTRGLHPSCMYSIDRSLKSPPKDTKASSVYDFLIKLFKCFIPKTLAVVSKNDLCYGHVLMAYRLKQDDKLRLKMLKSVNVSSKSGANYFTDGIVDLLPEQSFLGLSKLSYAFVLLSATVGVGSLIVVAPAAFLVSCNPELVLAWSLAACATAAATSACVWLRHWKLRADWSERLRRLSVSCDFNSGSFTLAHLLGLSQAELVKSSLLVYSLLLQPTSSGIFLNRSQLEIRAESWIAHRLSPHSHISLPSSLSRISSSSTKKIQNTFTGGSGPLFDLVFDSAPALRFLRHLDLVRGPDEQLQAVPLLSYTSSVSGRSVSRLWSFLTPESEEDDLGFPRVQIKQ